jgi:hypothetical protein
VFTLLALELVGHPEQRAADHGAVVVGEIHDPSFDNEVAKFNLATSYDFRLSSFTPINRVADDRRIACEMMSAHLKPCA